MSITSSRNPLCISTVVFGRDYQFYIPIYIYSVLRSYPDYYPLIFVSGELLPRVAKQIDILGAIGDFEIVEQYSPLERMEGQPGKSLRFVLDTPQFDRFRSVYIGDIDIFILREEPSLFEQHVVHCGVLDLPYSNVQRPNEFRLKRDPASLLRRLFREGLGRTVRSIFNPVRSIRKLSGLHFFMSEPYLAAMRKLFPKYRKIITLASESKLRLSHHLDGFNNECLLYDMIEESGLGLPPRGPYGLFMLNYRNYQSPWFRPHHGLHLGVFRSDQTARRYGDLIEGELYREYSSKFKNLVEDDHVWEQISKHFSQEVRELLSRMENAFRDK